jgi:NADH-quinone oxidoreductase subunit M
LVQRLFYGPESELSASTPGEDLHPREMAALWPLAVLMLVMGLAPSIWLPAIENSLHLPRWKESAVLPSSALTTSLRGEAQR